jgi:protein-S-isoprenylcysteine O-methyltransferase Ste14
MKRLGFLVFALTAYAIFTLTFLYLVAFLADIAVLRRAVDHPATSLSAPGAVLIDLALVAAFGLQHSMMARQGFKAAWTRIVPRPIERSCYVIFACLALVLIFAFWQPLPALAWDLRGSPGYWVVWGIFAAGWLLVFVSTYLIDHFELFGLSQAFRHWRSMPPAVPEFRQPLLYKLVRHPLYSGFIIAFWATPVMSYGHLLFAGAMSLYMLVAIALEERDLVALFGAEYEVYRKRVGKLFPRIR